MANATESKTKYAAKLKSNSGSCVVAVWMDEKVFGILPPEFK